MKYEVTYGLESGEIKSFITKDYGRYPRDNRKFVSGLYQIGFIKEGKTRMTWIPYKPGEKYTHIVEWIKIKEVSTGKIVETIECIR